MRRSLLFSVALGIAIASPSGFLVAKGSVYIANSTSFKKGKDTQQTIRGKVSDSNGPVLGVTVQVVGSATITSTDASGNFTVSAPEGAVLRFSSVGYKTQDIRPNSDNITVVLEHDENSLEQVVVVGYGTQKRANLTGAVSSVNADEVFHNRPIPDVARGLQGVIPGLNIRVPSGEVGSDPLLRVRGQVASPNGGAAPLVLVDNVEVPSLQYVNPNDVETVTVLKDAASTSIYGAKAAFGVVLITTKKGSKSEKDEFIYSNNFIVQSPFKDIEMAGIDGAQYTYDAHRNMKGVGPAGGFWGIDENSLRLMREWEEKYGGSVSYDDPVKYGRDWYWDGALNRKFGVRNYDPAKVMVKDNAFSHMHNLSLNGRRGATAYNVGLGFIQQNGMMKPANHDDYMRLNPSIRLSTKVNDFLTIRGGVMFSEGRKRTPTSLNANGYVSDPWLYAFRWSRLFPIGVQDNGEDLIDPAFSARSAPDAVTTNRFTNLNLGTTVDFTKNWNLQVDYSYNAEDRLQTSAVPYVRGREHWYGVEPRMDAEGRFVFVDENGDRTYDGGIPAYQFPMVDHTTKDNTYVSRSSRRDKRHTFNAFSTYDWNVDENHNVKMMVGTNIVASDDISHSSRRSQFLLHTDNPQFQYALGEQLVEGENAWQSQAGFFGRLNYAFQDKYLVEANLRYDGSSKFPAHLKWRWFPSFSAGWVLSNERFMEGLRPVLSFAKFRGSWGRIGDQSVANNWYIPRMVIPNSPAWIGAGSILRQVNAPASFQGDILWQDIEHLNFGADLRFFNNKLGVTADWFERNTKNMLIPGETLPATFGTGAPTGNYGDLRTRGWEIAVDYAHQFDNGLRLSINANISDAVSVTTRGADHNTPWENRGIPLGHSTTSPSQFSTGRTYGDVYGFVTDRLYQKEDFLYDSNGDFVTTTIIRNGSARTVNVLAGENPVYQTYFQDGGPVMMISPGDVKFADLNGDGFIDNGNGTNGNPGDVTVIGNITPRYEYGFRLGADFKGFDLAVFFQGVGKRSIWGEGPLATPGYHVRDGAMSQVIAEDYWREDRTDAFYPRAWHMNGSSSNWVMRPQSRYMLDMSYLKIKNITVGYNLPANIANRVKFKSARVYVSLENFITFDNLRGLPIDPEAISGVTSLTASSNYNLGRTGLGNPSFRSASAGVQIGF
ncbi:SusC/RagA family TonB-linked outer membrane protein [Sphingobacterium pedocola]|uniref:SusC/RagA family protein n=1 Tax=Sphingobacterium pedocola TaxID=2082722 RepID=A0ABR9TCD8_9SPHI|nr:SusC/RagA family TonB-linked outer membrane protein [Sphingobacterium pedocola]MBE8722734.1 SusC/RagA family protein [Sphingobacterium pedocola]